MTRFKYLLKQKSKALKVFEEAQARLSEVIVQLNREVQSSEAEIDKKAKEIEAEREAIRFAMNEINAAENTRKKIEEILTV